MEENIMENALKSDLRRVRKMSDKDIELAASQDPDARPMSDEELSKVRWISFENFLPTPPCPTIATKP